jgi:hypothetical protein
MRWIIIALIYFIYTVMGGEPVPTVVGPYRGEPTNIVIVGAPRTNTVVVRARQIR